MATALEVQDREAERGEAERFGWTEDRIDTELPVLFTEREWDVMLTDPAFGYVCQAGHRLTDGDRAYGGCYSCEFEAESYAGDE